MLGSLRTETGAHGRTQLMAASVLVLIRVLISFFPYHIKRILEHLQEFTIST